MHKLYIFPDPLTATCVLETDSGASIPGVPDTHPSGRQGQSFSIPDSVPNGNGATLKLSADGYTTEVQRGIPCWGNLAPLVPAGQACYFADDFHLAKSPFPVNPPTREEVLGVNLHFRGGLAFPIPPFSMVPWWPTALTQFDESQRRIIYERTRAAGDTHQIVHISAGKNDHRNETFYDQFPWVDLTHGLTKIDPFVYDLIDECILEGFKVIVTMDEGQQTSPQIVRLFMQDLKADRVPWVLTLPGYDGVFYGWEPSNIVIPLWASIARSIHPQCYLGIEFNTGHIPLGNGPADYAIGGLMDGYDAIFGEFATDDRRLTGDAVWQILMRCITPYHPAPDQPPPYSAPFYLTDSMRGPRTFVAFETWQPFDWVRTNMSDPNAIRAQQANIQAERDYFAARGCRYIG